LLRATEASIKLPDVVLTGVLVCGLWQLVVKKISKEYTIKVRIIL
jgi:hypothetical protein